MNIRDALYVVDLICICQISLDLNVIARGAWLGDEHINAAQRLLQAQYPLVDGLQDTLLGTDLIV